MMTGRFGRSIARRCLAAVITVAVAGGCQPSVRELRYDRRPLGDWARDLGDRMELRRRSAVYALAQSGEDGVAFAVAALEGPDWLTRQTAVRAAFLLSGAGPEPALNGIARCLQDPDPRVHKEAALWLRRLVTAALEARAPAESEAGEVKGPSYTESGDTYPLADLAAVSAVLPLVLLALENADPGVRSTAATVLSAYGAEGAVASPGLERLLGDPEFEVRLAAAVALARCGTEEIRGTVPVPLLLEALGEERLGELDGALACEVPPALAALGPRARVAVPVLVRLVAEVSMYSSLREGCIEALGTLGPVAREAIPVLEGIPGDDFQNQAAKDALEKIRGH